MGEAKRRWLQQRVEVCACGSGKPGGDCCWTLGGWFKLPARIDLVNTGKNGNNSKCYLRHLNACSDTITGEHMISRTVLEALGKDKIRISGAPWLKEGENREIGINSLVANCLCDAHNQALSPLDSAAGQFYRTLEGCLLNDDKPPGTYLFSGHDIERWLLKMTAGLAASKNLAAKRQRLPGTYADGVDMARLLQDPEAWQTPAGMYVIQKLGDMISPRGELAVAPLASDAGEIGGLMTQLHGFMIALLLKEVETIKGSALEGAPYRIEKLFCKQPTGLRTVQLSWVRRIT